MTSPTPPVPFTNQCSIIYNNTLYVYSPEAFQALPLSNNATWTQLDAGVSVTGATCVKGGTDGDSDDIALYVVGGTTNSSVTDYTGIQRYSFIENAWKTITPDTWVTANRINHGATYLNASSAILVYGGSQNDNSIPSTETFLMLMYPPYRVQAYSSVAPAVTRPFVLPFDEQQAILVGGSADQELYVFHPTPGWYNFGLALPFAIPDGAVAQCNTQLLNDGTKILQTFYMSQSPNLVTRNVLMQAGGQRAYYGETIGDPSSSAGSKRKRQAITQQSYPSYNASSAPSTQRLGFSLASDNSGETVAIVGGDADNTVIVFDASRDTFVPPANIWGSQVPLTTSSATSSSSSATSTSSPTSTSSLAATPSHAVNNSNSSATNSLIVLAGVLGGICGLVALILILLLCLRSRRRRRRQVIEAAKASPYSTDKDSHPRGDNSFDSSHLQALAVQAQPMGRSPVPSTAVSDAETIAMFAGSRFDEKTFEAHQAQRQASLPTRVPVRPPPTHIPSASVGSALFKQNKMPLVISKPMMPNLGDYQERPSIELGTATPARAPVLPPVAAFHTKTASEQRKTDEGWAKYFENDDLEQPAAAAVAVATDMRRRRNTDATINTTYSDTSALSTTRPISRKGGGTFWPNTQAPSPATKFPKHDSQGNPLTRFNVVSNSPNMGDSSTRTSRNPAVVEPRTAQISSGESVSTDHSSDDDDYEDDQLDDGASDMGHASYLAHRKQESLGWTPVGETWSSAPDRPPRPPSLPLDMLHPPGHSTLTVDTATTSSTGNSSIPQFPMPAAIGRPRPISKRISQNPGPPPMHPAPVHNTPSTTPGSPTKHRVTRSFSERDPRKGSIRYREDSMIDHYSGAGSTPDHKLPDTTDMSWINLGTSDHQHQQQYPSFVPPAIPEEAHYEQQPQVCPRSVLQQVQGRYDSPERTSYYEDAAGSEEFASESSTHDKNAGL